MKTIEFSTHISPHFRISQNSKLRELLEQISPGPAFKQVSTGGNVSALYLRNFRFESRVGRQL